MQQRSEETRTHLLEAAVRLFGRQGYEASSVAEICAAAGVSKGAFYHHFPSKHEVFMQLLENWLKVLDIQLFASRASQRTTPEALREMAGMASGIFEVAGGRLHMFLEFWSQANRDPVVWEATIAPFRRYQAFFTSFFENGITEGSLKPVDAQNAGRVALALAIGLLLQSLLDPKGADWSASFKDGIDMLLDGISADPQK
jgi:AcrR family transcriptional regulator